MSGMAASAMGGTFAGVSGIILPDVRSIGGHLADSSNPTMWVSYASMFLV